MDAQSAALAGLSFIKNILADGIMSHSYPFMLSYMKKTAGH